MSPLNKGRRQSESCVRRSLSSCGTEAARPSGARGQAAAVPVWHQRAPCRARPRCSLLLLLPSRRLPAARRELELARELAISPRLVLRKSCGCL